MSEHLWSLATPKGVNLDAISRGGIPELTQEDVALAAAGLPRIEFAAAMYSLAGDDSMWSRLRTYLLEYLLSERERYQWGRWIEQIDGQRVRFAEPLVELFLAEERRPSVFQAAPHLRAVALRVEQDVWRRVVSHQWAAVSGEYQRRLVSASDHVRRKMRRGY
jgi:hypothetical protein